MAKNEPENIELVAIPGIHYHFLRHRDPEHSYFAVKDFLRGTPFKNHNVEVIDLQLNMIVGILLRLENQKFSLLDQRSTDHRGS